MVCFPEYKAGRAEVCKMDKGGENGGATFLYVRLPDGYLLDCGYGRGAQERAEAVAACVNVLMKWTGSWPPIGVVESIVKHNFEDETRYYSSLPATEDKT